jgi:hypothetical protein
LRGFLRTSCAKLLYPDDTDFDRLGVFETVDVPDAIGGKMTLSCPAGTGEVSLDGGGSGVLSWIRSVGISLDPFAP